MPASLTDFLQTAYWALLILLAVGVAVWRPPVVTRCVFAIIGCGVVSLALCRIIVWPSDNYAFAMMLVNATAAYIILRPPPSLWQAIIGATYLTQIGLHAAKIIMSPSDMNSYYSGLSVMAFLQLAVVGGWWLDESLARRRTLRSTGQAAYPAHRKGHGR